MQQRGYFRQVEYFHEPESSKISGISASQVHKGFCIYVNKQYVHKYTKPKQLCNFPCRFYYGEGTSMVLFWG